MTTKKCKQCQTDKRITEYDIKRTLCTDGLSYAYVVPYEYVSNFLENEPKNIIKINYEIDVLAELQGEQQKTRKDYFDYVSEKCEDATEQVIIKHCEVILNTQSYRKGLY